MRKLAIVLFVLLFAQSLFAVQIGRPSSDVLPVNFWAPSAGSDLYAMLDEVTPNDADYIYYPGGANPDYVVMSAVDDPGVHTGHIIRVRAKNTATTATIGIYFYCGSTFIRYKTWEVTTSWATLSHTLSEADADKITDYSNVKFGFLGSDGREWVSWAEFEVPDVPPTPYVPNKAIIVISLCFAFVSFRLTNKFN